MMLNQETTSIPSLSESLLTSISEITGTNIYIKGDQQKFLEIGCYFYRLSIAIMELQTNQSSNREAILILQSLSKGITSAKKLVERYQKSNAVISDTQTRSITVQLQEVVNQIGECLQSIPQSTFGDQDYARISVKSLSSEMQNAFFDGSHLSVVSHEQVKQLMFLPKDATKEELVPTEADLYPIDFEVSPENENIISISQVTEFHEKKISTSQRKTESATKSLLKLPQAVQYIEPLYKTFFCPLTKAIMEDPVTIETGVTYERKAITEWFEKFKQSEKLFCPTTEKKLTSRSVSTNLALKTIIDEWRERDEAARIKLARAALSLSSSESMVMEAIEDLQSICQRNQYNNVQVRNVGIIPLLVKFLGYKDRDVRCATLTLLQMLAENDADGKEMIAKTIDISTVFKLLSSSHQLVRHASLLFLLELSKSLSLCEMIGCTTGGILLLITIKFDWSVDAFGSEKADQILKNLEISAENVKRMAENGWVQPLLNHLSEGSEEMQLDMASYLGEIVLGQDSRAYVTERASPVLIKMVQRGNTFARREAFKALKQISSYHLTGKILVKSGIVKVMAEEIFMRRIYNEPMNSQSEAAAILANILESGIEHESLRVNAQGHTFASEYVVYSIICMLKNSTPEELNINLIRVLLCLTNSPKSMETIVSVIRENDTSCTLIELINNPHEELVVAAIKLLTALSPHMGHMLVEGLCKTRGQPENLIQCPTGASCITEKQAVSVKFLAELPHQNLTLNLALVFKNTVPTILKALDLIQISGTGASRFAMAYLEGLVGILVRFTTTLYESQMLFLAINHNLTSVFTGLLMKISSDEIQRLSATGLSNLSSESVRLSKPPQIKRTKYSKIFSLPKSLSISSMKKREKPVCPIHRGACSSKTTFCLVDANVTESLLACLNHRKTEVVDAALSALCTLMDDRVDVEKSVSMLTGLNAIHLVLNMMKEHKEESLNQKAFWIIDRFLVSGGSKSFSDISQDRLLPYTLVNAFHHGDNNTRQMAEKVLKHLNKMPNFTVNHTM